MNTQENSVIAKLVAHVKSECNAIDQEGIYDDMLDECYSFESVGGIFANMSPSRVLQEVDPIAYRCGMNDYFGSGDEYFEIDSDLYERRQVEKAADEFFDELDSEISDLESEIEDMEADGDPDLLKLSSMKRNLADLQADLETAKAHTF